MNVDKIHFKKFNISKMISNKDRGEKKKEGGNSTTKVFGVPFDRTSNTIPGVIKRVVEYFDVKGNNLFNNLSTSIFQYNQHLI